MERGGRKHAVHVAKPTWDNAVKTNSLQNYGLYKVRGKSTSKALVDAHGFAALVSHLKNHQGHALDVDLLAVNGGPLAWILSDSESAVIEKRDWVVPSWRLKSGVKDAKDV